MKDKRGKAMSVIIIIFVLIFSLKEFKITI